MATTSVTEKILAFAGTHPDADLRVRDGENPRVGEGRLYEDDQGSLRVEFPVASGKNEYLFELHGGRFTLTGASIATLQKSAGLEALEAAQLVRAPSPSLPRPAPSVLRQEYDPLRAPISPQTTAFLAQLLRLSHGLALNVVDLKSAQNGIGCLRLGECETLQAAFGDNAFAVQAHPDRFQLTQEGIAAISQARRDLERTALEGADMAEPREYVADAIRAALGETEEEKLKKRAFAAALEEILEGGRMNIRSTYLMIDRLTPSSLRKLENTAIEAGVIIDKHFYPQFGASYSTIYGDELSELLFSAMTNKHHGREAEILRGWDAEKVGPYALLIDCGLVCILHKKDFLASKKV